MGYGITLVEQIIASHSAVHGAGERRDLEHQILRIGAEGASGGPFPDWMRTIDPGLLEEAGGRYVDAMCQGIPGAVRVTDKTPANFLYIGFIRLALPGARIIHCRRHPIDVAFSCYRRHFVAGCDFAYDLDEIVRYYRMYERLMAHWSALVPDAVLDVRYEDLVSDLEGQSRRMLAVLDLAWEDACLSFHATRRAPWRAPATSRSAAHSTGAPSMPGVPTMRISGRSSMASVHTWRAIWRTIRPRTGR